MRVLRPPEPLPAGPHHTSTSQDGSEMRDRVLFATESDADEAHHAARLVASG
jgi:hypothetical protein